MTAIDELTLGDIMSRRIVAVAPSCALGDAAREMAAKRISSLVIVEDGRAVGILTERDMVRLLHDRTPTDAAVSSVMSRPVLTAPLDLDFRSGYALLRQYGVRHLLVLDGSGEPVGIATATDFRTHLGLEVFQRIGNLRSVQDPVAAELAPAATLAEAIRLMVTTGSDYVLIVARQKPCGILTERDLSRLLADHADLEALRVDAVMTAPVHCLSSEVSVAEAAAAMARLRVRHMPVTDARDVLLGVVSQARLLERIGVELLEQERQEDSGLREDNARLQDRLCLALEAGSLGTWEYDHQLDRVSWSRSLCELLGYSEEQAPAGLEQWLQLIHPDDRTALQGGIAPSDTPEDTAYEAEYRLRKGDGAWCWIHARGRVIQRTRTGEPVATAGTMADITDRKQAEALLLAQHTLWQALAGEPDEETLWTAILDSALKLPDLDCGAVYEVSAETCTLMAQRGLAPDFQFGNADLEPPPPLGSAIRDGRLICRGAPSGPPGAGSESIDRPTLPDEGLQAIAALPIRVGDRVVAGLYLASRHTAYLDSVTRDGLNRLVEPFTRALQQFRAQEEARFQRQNIAGLFDAMTDFVFVIAMDGRILHYNQAVARRLAPQAGWVGLPIWQVHPEDMRDAAKLALTDILAGHRSTCSLPLVTLDGQRLAVDTRVVPGQWDGQPVLLGIARDVTELAGQRDAASRSEILLRTTLDSTADGLLVVGEDGARLVMNQRFRELWRVPESLAAAATDEPLLQHVRDQLIEPDAFVREVQRLYGSDDEQTDYLEFTDGRIFERFTRPLRLGARRARLWSFRDMTERARARRAVEYERARLRVLIRTIPDLVWLKDPDGVYLACNPAFENLYGAPESEIVGKTDYDFVERDLADFFRQNDHAAVDSRAARVNEEWLSFARGGYRGLFETIKTPMYGTDGALIGVLGIARDITEIKQTQAELEQEVIRRRILFEQSTDGIVVLDEQGGVYESNERFAAMIGYSPDETGALHVWDWDAQWTREELLERLVADPPSIFETRHRRKNGSVYDVEVSTNRAEWNGRRLRYCVCRDISARKAAESALLESEERFRATFAQAAHGIALIDAETLRFTQFNDAAHQRLGYSREEFAALDLPAIQAEFDPVQIQEKVATILATGGADFESRHRRKDGQIRDVEITNRVINLRGRSYFAAVWSDITEQKRAETALRETAMFLKESQSIARVGGWKANPATGLLIWTEEVYRLVEHPLDQPPESLEEGLKYYAPEYLPVIRGLLLTAWEQGTPFTTECEMITGTGRRFWAELRCVGRVEQDGQAFITGTFQDITERRRLEDEIRRREKYLRAVIDNFPFLVWLKDAEGRFLAVNAPFAQACGQAAPDAVVGKTDLDVWPPDLAARYRDDDQAVLASGQPLNAEEPIEERGHRRWIETYKSPIVLDGHVLGTVGFARDITLRRETESRLRDSEQALRQAQAVAHIGSWTLDIRRDTLRWSDETYRLFDLAPGTPLSLGSFLACIHPDDSGAVREAWERALNGAPYDIEHRVVTRAEERWVRERAELRFDGTGTPVFALGTVQDITERRTADEQLRKLWLAVEQSPNSIVITDAEGRIEYVNQAFVDTTGYTREQALGENPRLLKSERTPESTFADLWSALTRGETWQGEFINRRRDGSLYTEHARLSPVRQPGGRITHYLAVKEDITERKLAAAELDRYRHHLEELVTERTAELAAAKEVAEAASRAKSTFLANMSHEIRTPLNAIVGLTYLLQRKVPDQDAQRQLGKVAESANHLLTLINDILDISKIEAGKLTLNNSEFDLVSVLQRVSALFWDKAVEKGLELVYDVDPELTGNLFGDAVRLGQVLMNLVGNAVKFTERGQILVRISRQSERTDTLWLRCEVRDTGIGIRAEDQVRLFAAFEQADGSTTRRYGGTGLGLAISQRLVHLMGGEIGVSSAPGQGSVFWFTTRLGKLDTGGPTVRDTLRSRVQGQRALVAERQPGAREVLARLLRDLGLSVETASSGAEAVGLIAAAERGDRPFAVALMDPQLSGLSQTEAARDATGTAQWRIPNLIWLGRSKMPLPAMSPGQALSVNRPVTPADLHAILEQAIQPPATGSAARDHGSPSQSLPKADYGSYRLLVVEDNAVNQEVVLALLEELGISADLATNGAEAVAMARDRSYDLILMDVQMPVLDGLAATRAIRELTGRAAVPIVAMTANAFDEDRARCLEAGMNGMLVKPIEPAALFGVVTERLALREDWERPLRPGTPTAVPLPSGTLESVRRLDVIDTARGLGYTGGNAARYLRALRMFCEGHGEDPIRLRELFEAGRWPDAEQLAHSIKGVAALLGATQLQGRAADLEAALRARAEGAVLEETLAALAAAHDALLSVLPGALVDPATTDPPLPSVAATRNALLALEALLAEDNAAVSELFKTAAPQLRGAFGDRANELARLLDRYDYPPALALVHELLAALAPGSAHED